MTLNYAELFDLLESGQIPLAQLRTLVAADTDDVLAGGSDPARSGQSDGGGATPKSGTSPR